MSATAWAEWVAAIATVVAVGAATYAGLKARDAATTARDLFEQEQRRDDRIERMDRQAQAAKIAVWLEVVTRQSMRFQSTIGEWPGPALMLRNASDVPVYDLRIGYHTGERFPEPIATETLPILPPVDVPLDHDPAQAIHDLFGSYEKNHAGFLDVLRVAVEFTDSSNITWKRDIHGALTELRNPTPRPSSWP
jgi:hypothetical protein